MNCANLSNLPPKAAGEHHSAAPAARRRQLHPLYQSGRGRARQKQCRRCDEPVIAIAAWARFSLQEGGQFVHCHQVRASGGSPRQEIAGGRSPSRPDWSGESVQLSARIARTPRSFGPLAAQSRLDPAPYSLPAITISGTLSAAYRSEASKMVMISCDG